jgi:hypothetical protein
LVKGSEKTPEKEAGWFLKEGASERVTCPFGLTLDLKLKEKQSAKRPYLTAYKGSKCGLALSRKSI